MRLPDAPRRRARRTSQIQHPPIITTQLTIQPMAEAGLALICPAW
jgi:hypothetical protein